MCALSLEEKTNSFVSACVCVFLNSYGYEDQMSSHKDRQNDEILPVLTSTQSQATISVYRFKVRIKLV